MFLVWNDVTYDTVICPEPMLPTKILCILSEHMLHTKCVMAEHMLHTNTRRILSEHMLHTEMYYVTYVAHEKVMSRVRTNDTYENV